MPIIGLLLATSAVIAAIVWRFPYWYTPFTIGSFLLFDRLSERYAHRSVLQYLARGRWRVGVLLYLIAAGLALIVDVVYGRILAGAWVYPSWHGLANIVIPVFFHYPFGFLSLYATFQALRGMLGVAGTKLRKESPREDTGQQQDGLSSRSRLFNWYGPLSLITLVACVVVPLLNYWLNASRGEGELLFIVMLVSTVAFDGTRDLLTGDSILRALAASGKRYAGSIILTLAWAVPVNEGPNLFAREWVYLIHPFGLPLWAILILGWPFLLIVSTAVYEATIALISRNLGYTGFE